jgi:hypothetical protein
LPSPRFDDEATLISARRVVPITAARSADRKRILRRALPLIAMAGLVGIVVGLAVGYYTRRRIPEAAMQRAQTNASAAAAATSPTESPSQLKSEITESAPEVAQTTAGQHPVAGEIGSAKAQVRRTFPRVHTRNVFPNQVRNRNRGASHIEEIFAGSNP